MKTIITNWLIQRAKQTQQKIVPSIVAIAEELTIPRSGK